MENQPGNASKSISLVNFARGMYFLTINSGHDKLTAKFVKE